MSYRVLLFVLLLASATAFAQQSPKILVATGKFQFVETLNPGALDCAGGQPTGRQLQCSPGTKKISAWNWVGVQGYQDVAGTAATMVGGRNTLVMHCNLDEKYYGHCWGTFEWAVPEMDGKWEGVWSGPWDMSASGTSFHMTGYGSGGRLEGLRLELEGVGSGSTAPGTFVLKVEAK